MYLSKILIGTLFIMSYSSFSQPNQYDDGPYIFLTEGNTIAMWVKDSVLLQKIITKNNFGDLKSEFNFKFGYEALIKNYRSNPNDQQEYTNVDSLIAFSDIHGQYDLYIDLLKANYVIDKNLNWSFGTGHLVIVGDVFDRGDKVTEVLWHLFGLEKQAENAGGKIHLLLGNHEVMVMNKDLRYLHEKYINIEKMMNKSYDQLYSEQTILGNWLRSKPVVIKINDMIFNHAGLSPALVNKNITIEKVNNTFRNQIVGCDRESILKDEFLELLYRSDGPIWYRGYFYDELFTEKSIDSVLNYYNANHAIAGHCSYDSIVTKFDNKIIGVDSSIKLGEYGELLKYDGIDFYRCTLNGDRKEL